MSYILEALKKSERERARGNIPALETASRLGTSYKSLWLGVLLGAGGLILLVAIAWFISLQFYRWHAPAAESAAPDGEAAAAGAPAATTGAGSGAGNSTKTTSTGGGTQPEETTGDASRRVANINGLDAEARRRIEELSINVVSYSDAPERRFIMLNQRIVRESETVGDGIVVKRITPEGALLVVGNYEILVSPD